MNEVYKTHVCLGNCVLFPYLSLHIVKNQSYLIQISYRIAAYQMDCYVLRIQFVFDIYFVNANFRLKANPEFPNGFWKYFIQLTSVLP